MVRSIALIIAAIRLSRPDIPDEEAERYAKTLLEEAKEHRFDPFTGVAIIHYETAWLPKLVSKSGEDIGLSQIRARYVGGCKGDPDPVRNPSPACKREKERLLDGQENIREMARIITENRKFCKKKVGSARFERWLASFQGRNYPKKKKWCAPGDHTWRVIDYRKHLIRKLVHKRG